MNTVSSGVYTFRWLLAWAALLAVLTLANRTRAGHVAIYYLLLVTLLLLLVTQFRWLANVLAPFQTVQLAPATS